jgi:hypothetical protein
LLCHAETKELAKHKAISQKFSRNEKITGIKIIPIYSNLFRGYPKQKNLFQFIPWISRAKKFIPVYSGKIINYYSEYNKFWNNLELCSS